MNNVSVIYLLLIGLTLMIHMALAAGVAIQTSDLLKKLPPERQRISPKLSWLLLIPLFNCVWIWILLMQTSRSFEEHRVEGRSSFPLAIGVAASYSVLFFLMGPNWAWVVALLVFIPYQKRLLQVEQKVRTSPSESSPVTTPDPNAPARTDRERD